LLNDSVEDHKRVEYLSGYIGSTLTALRYTITCSALCDHGKMKIDVLNFGPFLLLQEWS
jgi:hypothetical protein